MGSLDQESSPSLFSALKPIPYDEAYRVSAAYTEDPSPDKISLGAGVYRDDDGRPWTLTSVKQAIPLLPDNHDYLPQTGFPPFLAAARDLILGTSLSASLGERLTSIQTVSGTGACHVGAVFLASLPLPQTPRRPPRQVWISDPSWINHALIWECAGGQGVVRTRYYPYYDARTRGLDFAGMRGALEGQDARSGDVVILQACAHNPTGLDPTREQWIALADLCEEKGLVPFFDCAYQGFASGDIDEDAWAVRHFVSRPALELCIAQSFSKNFGLYGERVGALHVLSRRAASAPAVRSQLVRIVRSEVSSAPSFGCRIVAAVLGDAALRSQWCADLKTMSQRIRGVRVGLFEGLKKRGTPGTWEHIIAQIGMFSYTGLNQDQVKELEEKWHIYLLSSGRASIPGLTSKNVARVAEAIDSVVRKSTNA
ncbi:aspartate aminotransferase [Xylariomycetidae sp. FL2044]|nr:aspartate aminotransferase [Xylariomycetidae sp. FL2044]